jgi:hypothetical protein
LTDLNILAFVKLIEDKSLPSYGFRSPQPAARTQHPVGNAAAVPITPRHSSINLLLLLLIIIIII